MPKFTEPMDQDAIDALQIIRQDTGCTLEEATRIYQYWMGQAYAGPEWESVT